MRKSIRLGLTALMAAMLLASALGTASAGRLSADNTRVRVTWSRLEARSSAATIRCQVTLEGSFHERTITKRERTLIGSITRVDIFESRCAGGIARTTQPPPWHITYESFLGTLPNISAIRILAQGFQYLIEPGLGTTCRYGTATDTITGVAAREAGGAITTDRPVIGRNIVNLLQGGGFCPSTCTIEASEGDGIVTLLNSSTRIRITLI